MTAELPVEPQDLNAIYSAELMTLAQKPPKEVKNVSPEQKQEDYYKNFRTNVSEQAGGVVYMRWSGLTGAGAAVLDHVEWVVGGSDFVSAGRRAGIGVETNV